MSAQVILLRLNYGPSRDATTHMAALSPVADVGVRMVTVTDSGFTEARFATASRHHCSIE